MSNKDFLVLARIVDKEAQIAILLEDLRTERMVTRMASKLLGSAPRLASVVQHNPKQVLFQLDDRLFLDGGSEQKEALHSLFRIIADSDAEVVIVTKNNPPLVTKRGVNMWIMAMNTLLPQKQFIYRDCHSGNGLGWELVSTAYAHYRKQHPLHVFL